MYTLNANEAKTKFGSMLMKAQSEPVEIVKNGTPVAVVVSLEEYEKTELLKNALVSARFEGINESDLVDGKAFLEELESGKYD